MTSGIIAGAIRWDAWYDTSGASNASTFAKTILGPAAWQGSAPWFAQPISQFKLSCAGTQANMDAECTYAHGAGIKYWAFDNYQPSSGFAGFTNLSIAKALYDASTNKNLVNWCWMTFGYQWGSLTFADNTWQPFVAAWAAQFQQSNYQKVLSGRPLIYLFYSAADTATYFAGSLANLATAITYLRAQCTAASVPSPYVVIVGSFAGAASINTVRSTVGADAISAYAPPLTLAAVPDTYVSLDTQTQAYWASMAATGAKIIPNGFTGNDLRARRQTPDLASGLKPWRNMNQYWAAGTDAELVTHFQAMVNYINANPTPCESTAALIYSWTECDEGRRGLIPDLNHPPPSSTLAAVGPVLL